MVTESVVMHFLGHSAYMYSLFSFQCLANWKGDLLEIKANNAEKGWTMCVTREVKGNEMIVVRGRLLIFALYIGER